jgi:DNA repair exonuclease SbcCD nuclease subunit
MIKILHTADIHLDSPLGTLAKRDPDLKNLIQNATRSAFTCIVDSAIEHRVGALLVAGDLFDGKQRSAQTAVWLTMQLDRLKREEIKVFYIKGNHDAESPLSKQITLPDNVHIFDGHGGMVALSDSVYIHGVSFSDRHVPKSLLPKFKLPVHGAVNIAMLHTSLAGAEGHDNYAPCSVKQLTDLGFDYWALGHVHRREIHVSSPCWVVMPGMPQGRDIGESGPKSATLITVHDDKKIETAEVPTSAIEFLSVSVDVAKNDDDEALRELIRIELTETQKKLKSKGGVVRLYLRGSTPRRWQIIRDRQIWESTATEIARQLENLWIDKLEIDLAELPETSNSATDELAGIMLGILQDPQFIDAYRKQLETVLSELPPQPRRELIPSESAATQLTQELAKSGAELMISRMKGGAN